MPVTPDASQRRIGAVRDDQNASPAQRAHDLGNAVDHPSQNQVVISAEQVFASMISDAEAKKKRAQTLLNLRLERDLAKIAQDPHFGGLEKGNATEAARVANDEGLDKAESEYRQRVAAARHDHLSFLEQLRNPRGFHNDPGDGYARGALAAEIANPRDLELLTLDSASLSAPSYNTSDFELDDETASDCAVTLRSASPISDAHMQDDDEMFAGCGSRFPHQER